MDLMNRCVLYPKSKLFVTYGGKACAEVVDIGCLHETGKQAFRLLHDGGELTKTDDRAILRTHTSHLPHGGVNGCEREFLLQKAIFSLQAAQVIATHAHRGSNSPIAHDARLTEEMASN